MTDAERLKATPGYDTALALVKCLRVEDGRPWVLKGHDGKRWLLGLAMPEPTQPTPTVASIPQGRVLKDWTVEGLRAMALDILAQVDREVTLRRDKEGAAREGRILLPGPPDGWRG